VKQAPIRTGIGGRGRGLWAWPRWFGGPKEARRIARRFEFHYTPKHGSWLNVAEIDLPSTLSIQCLDQRIASLPKLRSVISAWRKARPGGKVTWRFNTDAARIKLKRLYPSIP
jgi:hypothetical protein